MYKIENRETFIHVYLSMTDKSTDKVNYTLDVHCHRAFLQKYADIYLK